MKYYIVEIKYTAPIEKIKEVVGKHREFLQVGYDKKMFLCSGPQEPLVGGIVIAKANSVRDLKDMFADDPYNKAGLTEYVYTEFAPVKRQKFLEENWIE